MPRDTDPVLENEPDTPFAWADIDRDFCDDKDLNEIFDDLITRQIETYGNDLDTPCTEAQELLKQWNVDEDHDYLPDWQEAVDRRQPEPDAGPQLLNDADILGTEPEGLGEFLSREASLLTGELWGAKDRRNTQDGDWKQVTLPWGAWIGGQEGTKNTAAWGFSRHPVGKDKAGSSIVLGSSIGGARKAKAMDTMFAMGLDVDSGAKLDDVLDTLEAEGILCFVYTSFNNGKRGIELKRDEVLRKMQITRDPEESEVRQFLREHDKNRYEESFIAECTIKEQKHQTTDGVKIILDTPPLEKFRLIFPLAVPVKIIELAETHEAALAIWENKITGLARNILGVHFDTSCTDPSRLFYTARHPKGTDDWYAAIVQGNPLNFDDIQPMKKAAYARDRNSNAFTMAGADDNRVPQCRTPSGASLNEWHRDAKDRFLMADLLETLCPDKIRVAGGEAQGHVHVECPFEHEHTSEGGTATMAVNAIDGQTEYWTWFCHHDACQGRHKLEFLEEALRQGWFDEAALTDPDAGFLLDVADGESDPFAPLDGDLGNERLTPEERAEAFTTDATDDDIRKFIRSLWRDGADMSTQANVTAVIARNTNLGKRDVKKFWKELEDAQKRRDKETQKADEGRVIVVNDWHFDEQHSEASRRLHEVNQTEPTLFHNMHDLCVIRAGSDGRYAIRTLDKDGFAHLLNTVVSFQRETSEKCIGVSAPHDVVNHLYSADRSQFPALQGMITTPSFTASGTLLTQPGYDWESKLFFKPDENLNIPDVSQKPTEEEVFEAKRLLVQEILADFMLDGMDRAETIRAALRCTEENGELVPIPDAEPLPAPSLAHAIVMALFPFVRDMIPGNAAGIAIDKQKPGAGAGKLEAAMSSIFGGRGTAAMALPTSPEEMTKVLLPALRSGHPNVFFDNISNTVYSGELASAMTAPTYQARPLHNSDLVEVDVRCQWVIAGIKLNLSAELIRRFVLIYIDPKTATPEKRTGFRHPDIEAWVRDNRGRLIWACLTLIQNWIAGGRKPGGKDKASYSQWAGVMGGILDAAGIKGFLGNEEDMKARSSTVETPIKMLIERLSEFPDGTHFVTGTIQKRHPVGTQSLKSILEEFHEDEEGEAKSLRLSGWGYDLQSGDYFVPEKLAHGFKRDVEGEPHLVGDVEVSFEVVPNTSGAKLWRLVKKTLKSCDRQEAR